MIISIEVTEFPEKGVKEFDDQRFIATISEGAYIHTVVAGKSISDCIHEIAVSIEVLEQFRKTHPEYARTDEVLKKLKGG